MVMGRVGKTNDISDQMVKDLSGGNGQEFFLQEREWGLWVKQLQ